MAVVNEIDLLSCALSCFYTVFSCYLKLRRNVWQAMCRQIFSVPSLAVSYSVKAWSQWVKVVNAPFFKRRWWDFAVFYYCIISISNLWVHFWVRKEFSSFYKGLDSVWAITRLQQMLTAAETKARREEVLNRSLHHKGHKWHSGHTAGSRQTGGELVECRRVGGKKR